MRQSGTMEESGSTNKRIAELERALAEIAEATDLAVKGRKSWATVVRMIQQHDPREVRLP